MSETEKQGASLASTQSLGRGLVTSPQVHLQQCLEQAGMPVSQLLPGQRSAHLRSSIPALEVQVGVIDVTYTEAQDVTPSGAAKLLSLEKLPPPPNKGSLE